MKIDWTGIGVGLMVFIIIILVGLSGLEDMNNYYIVDTVDGEIKCDYMSESWGEISFKGCENGYEYTEFVKYKKIHKD